MPLYPKKEWGQRVQTNAGVTLDRVDLYRFSIDGPLLGTTTKVHAAISLSGSATTTVTTAITNPDCARVLTVTGAVGGSGPVVITGKNIAGATISESISAISGQTVVGTKAFKTVTRIVIPVGTGTIAVGTGAKLGLPAKLDLPTILVAYFEIGRAHV
jgi:hypothetical protein